MSTASQSSLLRFAEALSIAHHIPGRIRLKLSGSALADLSAMAQDAKRFVAALSGVDGIRSVSLNPLAKSCTIEYDSKVIEDSAWRDLAAQTITKSSKPLFDKLVQAASL